MDHPTDAIPTGAAELAALQALRAQRQQERQAAEAEVFDLLRERCPGLDIFREIANGVECYSARALADDVHPWYVVKPTLEGLASALLRPELPS